LFRGAYRGALDREPDWACNVAVTSNDVDIARTKISIVRTGMNNDINHLESGSGLARSQLDSGNNLKIHPRECSDARRVRHCSCYPMASLVTNQRVGSINCEGYRYGSCVSERTCDKASCFALPATRNQVCWAELIAGAVNVYR